MARFAVITTQLNPTPSRNWWPIPPIFCVSSQAKRRLVRRESDRPLSVVFKPADDLVIVDYAGRAKALVVMQVRHASHGDSFADDRAINMSVRAAAVHRHVVSGRIDRSSNLTIATNAYVLR